jgi:hemoglobin
MNDPQQSNKDAHEDPQTTPYEQIGGASSLKAITKEFYALMDTQPNYKELRAVHGPDLGRAQERLFWFLSGWLGGPALYVEKVGSPMLRARHLPFPIGEIERDQWVTCMVEAMTRQGVDEATRDRLAPHFYKTADWMRNKAEDSAP